MSKTTAMVFGFETLKEGGGECLSKKIPYFLLTFSVYVCNNIELRIVKL